MGSNPTPGIRELIKIVLGGICQCCKRFSPGLFTCHACGSLVGPECVIEGTPFCKICRGVRK